MKNDKIKQDLMTELRERYKKLGLELIVQAILKDYLFEKFHGSGAEIEEFVNFVLPVYLENPTEEIHNVVMQIFLELLSKIRKNKK